MVAIRLRATDKVLYCYWLFAEAKISPEQGWVNQQDKEG